LLKRLNLGLGKKGWAGITNFPVKQIRASAATTQNPTWQPVVNIMI
jgi:hypothetical protein